MALDLLRLILLVHNIKFKPKVADNVFLPVRSIFPHEKFEHFLEGLVGIYLHWVQANIIADKMFKFIRGNLSQSL